jgi:hypothetical protein
MKFSEGKSRVDGFCQNTRDKKMLRKEVWLNGAWYSAGGSRQSFSAPKEEKGVRT